MIEESDAEPVDVAQVLRDKKVDVLISYLPVGSEEADKAYTLYGSISCGTTEVTARVFEIFFDSRRERCSMFMKSMLPPTLSW